MPNLYFLLSRRLCCYFGEDGAEQKQPLVDERDNGPTAAEYLLAMENAERILKCLTGFQKDIERSPEAPASVKNDDNGEVASVKSPLEAKKKKKLSLTYEILRVPSLRASPKLIEKGVHEMLEDADFPRTFDGEEEGFLDRSGSGGGDGESSLLSFVGDDGNFDGEMSYDPHASEMFAYESSSDESESDDDMDSNENDISVEEQVNELEPLDPEVVQGYADMLRVGVPHGAVRVRMYLDGLEDRQARLWLRLIEETLLELMRSEANAWGVTGEDLDDAQDNFDDENAQTYGEFDDLDMLQTAHGELQTTNEEQPQIADVERDIGGHQEAHAAFEEQAQVGEMDTDADDNGSGGSGSDSDDFFDARERSSSHHQSFEGLRGGSTGSFKLSGLKTQTWL